jgi:type I restriction enzyme S subunit
MMSEWKTCRLGDVATIHGGKRLPRGKMLTTLHTNHPYIRITDFCGHKILLNDIQYVANDIQKSISRYTVNAGELVISIVGTLGLCALIPEALDRANLTENCAKIQIKDNCVDKIFLYYYLTSSEIQDTITGFDVGSTQPKLPLYNVQNIPLLLPPLPEQQAIAIVLSSLDDKIDLLHRQNKTLEAIAETIWRKMFIEDADPGWEKKGLDKIATFLNGLPCQKYPTNNDNESLPVIKIKELRYGFTDESDLASTSVPFEYIVDKGDILFSWSGSLELVIWAYGKGILNQHLFKVTSNEYPKWFYYYWIKHYLPEFKDIAQDKATTMGHIQRHHLSNAIVAIPNEDVFKYVNAIISPIFNKITHNLTSINEYMNLRDTLLPKLMSGEVRVKV